MKKELELYIHIPFCVKKCEYCDFLSLPAGEEDRGKYVEALIREIYSYRQMAGSYKVVTVFLGGGTPSVLEAGQTEEVFRALYDVFEIDRQAEITTELNPGTVTQEKLELYRRVGINRLSIGLQSADDQELKVLGRIHSFKDFEETYSLARAVGFDNINVDLISAIPGQSVKSWQKTLEAVLDLDPKPEHLSTYSLIIEEGTPFWDVYEGDRPKSGALPLPDEEEERTIYHQTKERLENEGYRHYEISNYAGNGYECRHNLGYWERKEYLGVGLGASSLIDNERLRITSDLAEYLNDPGCYEEKVHLSRTEQMEEFMFLGLRETAGVSKQKFMDQFACRIEEVYDYEITKLIEDGLLAERNNRLRLTTKGIDLGNYVFASFIK